MTNILTRGKQDEATFRFSSTLTSSDIDKLFVVGSSATAALFTFASANSVAIGTVKEISQDGLSARCLLFNHTHKGIAGGSITGGGKLTYQSTTGYLIAAAGTLTANPIVGIAVSNAGASGEKFEWIPYTVNDAVVIA